MESTGRNSCLYGQLIFNTRTCNGIKIVSSINSLGKVKQIHSENESRPPTYTIHKNILKMNKRLNVSHETIKILEENIGSKMQTFLIAIFCQYISLGKGNKGQNKQIGLHQTKKLCTAKESINKMKREPTEWNNIFANDNSDKKLISKIYKELKTEKTNNPY